MIKYIIPLIILSLIFVYKQLKKMNTADIVFKYRYYNDSIYHGDEE